MSNPSDERPVESVAAVARRFGVSNQHIYNLISRGEIRHVRLGRRVLVIVADIEQRLWSEQP